MHGDAVFESHQFHGDLALVVVHRHHAVVATIGAKGAHKGRVGREGAISGKTTLGRKLHAGRDDAAFFVPKIAVIAVVRIQATHRHAWPGDAAGLQGLGDHGNGVGHFAGCEQIRHITQWHMGSDAGRPEVFQHVEFTANAVKGEEFGKPAQFVLLRHAAQAQR